MLRCPACPNADKINPVPGSGPLPCQVMMIGGVPGKEDNSRRRVFTGKAGQELDETYLPLAGLQRQDVRVTTACKCWAGPGREVKPDVMTSCSNFHLRTEIEIADPKILVLMGSDALNAIASDLDMDFEHGFPHKLNVFGTQRTVFPIYHPQSAFHDTGRTLALFNDFPVLKQVLQGRWPRPKDQYPDPHYAYLKTPREVEKALHGDVIALDTETTRMHASGFWGLSFSTRPGTGYVVRREHGEALKAVNGAVQEARRVLLHNGMFDIDVLAKQGVIVPIRRLYDTMIEAYHVNVPQGLKMLAYRLCGIHMQSFDDLTYPYAAELAVNYILKADVIKWPKPEPREVVGPDGNPKMYRPQGMNTKIKRLITDMGKSDKINPLDRWGNFSEEELQPITQALGLFPQQDIGLVPEDKALTYSARDADATIRIYPELLKRSNVRRIR